MSKRKEYSRVRRNGSQKSAKKGRRYTPQEKRKALELAARLGVQKAAERTGITPWSIYAWRNALLLAPLVEKPAPQGEGKERPSLPRAVQVPESVIKKVVTKYHDQSKDKQPTFGNIYQDRERDHAHTQRPDDKKVDGVIGKVKRPTEFDNRKLQQNKPETTGPEKVGKLLFGFPIDFSEPCSYPCDKHKNRCAKMRYPSRYKKRNSRLR